MILPRKKIPEDPPIRLTIPLGDIISSLFKEERERYDDLVKSMSFQRLKKFLESDSERATRLRQSLPFWEILNEQERHEFEKLKIEESLK